MADETSPSAVVQRQLDAYNRHDLAAFVATYAEDAVLFRMPGEQVVARGVGEIAQLYREKVFSVAGHRADLLGRLASGDKVVDHERVHGLGPAPFDAVAVYDVQGGRIAAVWLYRTA